MAGLAGLLMLHGAPLREDDRCAGLRIRDALAGDAAGPTIMRQVDNVLLIGPDSPDARRPEHAGSPRVAGVLAGRIDNAAEVRAELRSHGLAPATTDGTALLCAAYRRWGGQFAGQLEGAFAFALYDAQSGVLLCGRDRFGVEPLHYVLTGDSLAFASDIPTLLRWRRVRRTPDHDVLAHYLAFGFCPADRALIRDVNRLRPAHLLIAKRLRAAHVERYWHPPHAGAAETAAERDPISARDALFDEAARRIIADTPGPVGVLLPGDSTSALLAASLERAAARRGTSVHTFAVAVPGRHTTDNASACRAAHHAVPLEAATAAASLGLIPRRGEPFADPGAFALQAMLAAAATRVPVCVTAAGGPEMLLERSHYAVLAAALGRHRDRRIPATPRRDFHTTMPFVRDLYADLVRRASDAEQLAMAGPALIGSLVFSPTDEIGPSLERAEDYNVRDIAARVELTHGAPRAFAVFDLARFARAPALRAPFLDDAFTCRVLAASQAERLAMGVAPGPADAARAPLDEWLRSGLRERLVDTLDSAAFRTRELFCLPCVDRVLREHLDGTRSSGPLLWMLLCLDVWFAAVIEGRDAIVPAGAGGPRLAGATA